MPSPVLAFRISMNGGALATERPARFARATPRVVAVLWAACVASDGAAQPSAPAECPLDVPAATGPAGAAAGPPGPAWDLRCIELLPTPSGGAARGVVTLRPAPSPFGVSVTPEGRHRRVLSVRTEDLPEPSSLGPFTTYMVWATPLSLDPVVPLGELDGSGELPIEVSFQKFMIWVTAEASGSVDERGGPIVLRGLSPSARMEPHDLMTLAPGAEEPQESEHTHASAWSMPPVYPGVPMLPGMMSLEPGVAPLEPNAPEGTSIPAVQPGRTVTLPDGGTLDLVAGFVRATIAGRQLQMLAFNGQHPGPLLKVAQNTTIFVNFRNDTPFPTAIHWHGLRLDNRFDGVPGVTQDPVQPGESFRYTVHFPDAGVYWYHPHHREDVVQELGLYGNMLVDPVDPDHYGPVNREEVLIVDDVLLGEAGIVPFGLEHATHSLMGRFGNTFLVNGRPEWELRARRGEVVRFHLTNAANTRTLNLSFASESDDTRLPMKVVGTDVSRFEREAWSESAVLAPAERYIVEVLFDRPGRYELVNHVQGINHRAGVFLEERSGLGSVLVEDDPAPEDHREAFAELRAHPAVVADIDAYRDRFDDPVDHELVLTLEATSLPNVIHEAMRYDWVYLNPVEWTGTMPMMNWAVTGSDVRWILRDPRSGLENDAIDWSFELGDVVKVRIHNDRNSLHAMNHPLHIHGQRFLVLEQNGVPNENLGWKDTVLLPPGSTTDILLEISNPGRWMVHCHIAEHLEAGMQFIFDVEGS